MYPSRMLSDRASVSDPIKLQSADVNVDLPRAIEPAESRADRIAAVAPARVKPLRKQIYADLLRAIRNGQLGPGSRITSSRTLALELRVSRNTVLAALERLTCEGYLVSEMGKGLFVADTLPDSHIASGRGPSVATSGNDDGLTRALSGRGRRIAELPRAPVGHSRDERGTRAFAMGTPALDQFPYSAWKRIARKILTDDESRFTHYGDAAGYLPLRQAIAAHVCVTRGILCDPAQVVIVGGSQQALDLSTRLLLDPGDPVWVEDPGYLGSRAALVAGGADLVPVPVDSEGLSVERGVAIRADARLAIVTPSCQFPLGMTMSSERRAALLDWAEEHQSWIIEDDYDADFRYEGSQFRALRAGAEYSRIIYLSTFSKSVFPGLRLGFLICPPELTDAYRAAHMSADIHCDLFSQAVLADFMAEGHFDRHRHRMRLLYRERRSKLLSRLRRVMGDLVEVCEPEAGMHVVCWLPLGADDVQIADAARASGVEVWPLSIHAMQWDARPGLMLGFAATSDDEVQRGIAVLDRTIRRAVLEVGQTLIDTASFEGSSERHSAPRCCSHVHESVDQPNIIGVGWAQALGQPL